MSYCVFWCSLLGQLIINNALKKRDIRRVLDFRDFRKREFMHNHAGHGYGVCVIWNILSYEIKR